MNIQKPIFCLIVWVYAISIQGCSFPSKLLPTPQDISPSRVVVEKVDRETKIPSSAVKMSPDTDDNPPLLYSSDYENPVPVPGGINTAGAEDSPFISSDGNTLYFFFTPDVNIPPEKQILDGVSGLYAANMMDGQWGKAERIILQDPGKLAMDGCEYVSGNILWFCTAREGYTGIHWFTAEYQNGSWQNWRIADFNPDYKVGELHFAGDGAELYFHSDRPGGKGQLDIWVSKKNNGEWQDPINLAIVNTLDSEGWPAISPDGDDFWFSRNYSIWRSIRVNDEWQEAGQILSPLAGEPSIDSAGNLYFVHHFYKDDRMIEADIYVAYKK